MKDKSYTRLFVPAKSSAQSSDALKNSAGKEIKMEGPVTNRSEVRKSRELKRIGKEAKKRYHGVKGKAPKARIQKFVELRKETPAVDLTKQETCEKKYVNVLEAAEDMQIFGMSGSGYPAARKLEAVMNSKAKEKVCIINAVECEPSLLTDEWLMKNKFAQIQEGVKYLTQKLPFQKVILAAKLIPELQWQSSMMEYCQVPNRYPMGEEHLLIQQILHKTIRPDQYPAMEGILVMNVQTLIALAESIQGTYPEQSKYITVADLRSGQAAIARVQTGMNILQVLKKVMPEAQGSVYYAGGGAMSAHLADKNSQIDAHTGFLAYGNPIPFLPDAKCKKCGRCTAKCPMGIPVHKVITALEKNPQADLSSFGLQNCIECGNCTYVCGAMRDNMKFIQDIKEK